MSGAAHFLNMTDSIHELKGILNIYTADCNKN